MTSATNKGFLKRTNSDVLSLVHGAYNKAKSAEDTPLVISKESLLAPNDGLRIHKGAYCSRDKLSSVKTDKQHASSDEFFFNPVNGNNRLSVCSSPIVQPRPRSQTWQGDAASKTYFGRKFHQKLHGKPVVIVSLNPSINDPSLQPRSASAVLMKRPESSLTKYQKRLSAEIKTLKAVGIVTGCFLLSWIGFCLIYTIESLELHKFHENIIAAFMWLGYANSAINPFIYAGYNRQYRQSLKKILKCGNDMTHEFCNTADTQSVFSGGRDLSERKQS